MTTTDLENQKRASVLVGVVTTLSGCGQENGEGMTMERNGSNGSNAGVMSQMGTTRGEHHATYQYSTKLQKNKRTKTNAQSDSRQQKKSQQSDRRRRRSLLVEREAPGETNGSSHVREGQADENNRRPKHQSKPKEQKESKEANKKPSASEFDA